MTRYRIPKGQCRVEIRVSNSRFIATATHAGSVKEAQEFIRNIRAEMPDATHHVYAYKIGYGASISEGMSDDGEPSGTSGPPALAVLRGADVGDVVLVITRYFGGTKLGTGGLVSAYTSAAQAAFQALVTIEKVDRIRLTIGVPYDKAAPTRTLLGRFDALIDSESFSDTVQFVADIPADRLDALRNALLHITGGQADIEMCG